MSSQFDLPIGRLEIRAPNLENVSFKFIQSETGKIYELNLCEDQIESMNDLFALDPSLILSTLTFIPTITIEQKVVFIKYEYNVNKKPCIVIVQVPEKTYDDDIPPHILEMQYANQLKYINLEKRIDHLSNQVDVLSKIPPASVPANLPSPPPTNLLSPPIPSHSRINQILSVNSATFKILEDRINQLLIGTTDDMDFMRRTITKLEETIKQMNEKITNLEQQNEQLTKSIENFQAKN